MVGEANNMTKLKTLEVLEIRRLYATGKYTQRMLAKMYNITQSAIKSITKRQTWKHLN